MAADGSVDGRRARFQELAWRATPMGALSLRRRTDPLSGVEVHEVKLDDDFLMSSLFTVAEVELARLALARLPRTDTDTDADVVVGGLGLGYTAKAVLEHDDVRSLVVVEALPDVIEWHTQGLLPLGPALTGDPRCRLVNDDFFVRAASPDGLDPDRPGRLFHAVVVDIDHSPKHLLNPSHAPFYTAKGLARLARHLHPGGVFALWSNDPPDEGYLAVLAEVLADVEAVVVAFPNPVQGGQSTNTVYLGRRRPASPGAG